MRTIGWYRAQRRRGVPEEVLVGHALTERLLTEVVQLRAENERLLALLHDQPHHPGVHPPASVTSAEGGVG